MRAYERLLKYVKVHTTSAEDQGVTPSTPCQWDLARLLVDELKQLGLENPSVDENCIVTAWLPATPGCENAPALGFLAHMDTSPAFSGENVNPILHENYDGGDIVLPREGRVIRVSDFPFLPALKGQTLITADGSTLLGADDKAGVAEIVTLCEQLLTEGIPHGRICVAFTPDEEIGEGPDHFDVARLWSSVRLHRGRRGSRLHRVRELQRRLRPAGHHRRVRPPWLRQGHHGERPAHRSRVQRPPARRRHPGKNGGLRGLLPPGPAGGQRGFRRMDYIIRDHDRAKFEEKKALMERAAAQVRAGHPTAGVELTVKDSYYNMKEQLAGCMHLVDNAKKAAELAGVTPVVEPIRGGTDGARLSYMGLPCPNLGTGAGNFHGPYELASVEQMDSVVAILKHLVTMYAQR